MSDYREGYNQGVEDALNGVSTYLNDILSIGVVDMAMKHIRNELKEDGIIQESDFVTIKMDSDFFDVPDCAYDAILGKTFKCGELGSIMCVTGMPMMKGRESYEFLYEIYEYVLDSWEPQEYIWLQESAYGKYGKDEYKCLCLNSQTEMNIASENMFHLGKDGNLYKSYDCEDYYRFTECSSEEFNKARKEALKNFGEYKPTKE